MSFFLTKKSNFHGILLHKSILFAVSATLLILVMVLTVSPAMTQNSQIQSSPGGVQIGSTEVSEQERDPQIQDGIQDLGDIQADELTFLDPDTIPESVPTTDADFVFEVPVKVESLHENIEKISIICRIHDRDLDERGIASKQIELESGSFNGTVTVGVNVVDAQKDSIKLYYCFMKLKRKVGTPTWDIPYPGKKRVGNQWVSSRGPIDTRAHPDKPFNKDTQRDIPEYARY